MEWEYFKKPDKAWYQKQFQVQHASGENIKYIALDPVIYW